MAAIAAPANIAPLPSPPLGPERDGSRPLRVAGDAAAACMEATHGSDHHSLKMTLAILPRVSSSAITLRVQSPCSPSKLRLSQARPDAGSPPARQGSPPRTQAHRAPHHAEAVTNGRNCHKGVDAWRVMERIRMPLSAARRRMGIAPLSADHAGRQCDAPEIHVEEGKMPSTFGYLSEPPRSGVASKTPAWMRGSKKFSPCKRAPSSR